jgi:hypothetical protein
MKNELKVKQAKPRKPRSEEQAIKCQFCPKTFSFLHWNNGKSKIVVKTKD